MKKLTSLFLLSLLTCLPLFSMENSSQAIDKDDQRYLAGAVPEENGRVVFSKEFRLPGKSQKEIYDAVYTWMSQRLKENENRDSRIVYTDEPGGIVAGITEEWIVFKSKLLVLDRALLNCQISAFCKPELCTIKIEKIRYTYEETEKYMAENMITDQHALSKDKTKLVKTYAKWRRKTVDFADELFYSAAVAFGMQDPNAKAEEEHKEAQKAIANSGTLVIDGGNVVTPKGADEYESINLQQIPDDVYTLLKKCKWVIVIAQDQFNRTSMTANKGGKIEMKNGKAMVYYTLSDDQPTGQIEKATNYTLNLYAEGEEDPRIIMTCKKATGESGQARTYCGEILELLMK